MRRVVVGALLSVIMLSCGGDDNGAADNDAACAEVKKAEAAIGNRLADHPREWDPDSGITQKQWATEKRQLWSQMLILIEQNPDCYGPQLRAEAEAELRQLER